MHKTRFVIQIRMVILTAVGWLSLCSLVAADQPELSDKFREPPASARPRTWMHAMSGNMSKAGLTKDLEAMADAGIGGIILFNVTHTIPKGNVIFHSDRHTELTCHAARECERLGLSFGMHNCDGWTSSGGPWVTPEISMKQVVHRMRVVKGGARVEFDLPQPTARHDFYRDIAVLAYPALASELADARVTRLVTSSDPQFDVALATDGRIDRRSKLDASPQRPGWVQFDFGRPHAIRSVFMNMEKAIAPKGDTWLETSDDGEDFRKIGELKLQRQGKREHGFDDVFPAGITARFFRVITEIPFEISEIELSATHRIGKPLARTSLYRLEDHRLPDIGASEPGMVIDPSAIIDLSEEMDDAGKLTTTLPPGDWTIMRFGYTVTGAVNSPASDEGRGLEVDKMNRAALDVHYDSYVGKVIRACKDIAPGALQYMEIDSYEVGGQNWTRGYEDQFQQAHGYELIPFLPLYAGRFVDSAETSDDVCWDIRRFNSKLMTDNYFGHFTERCHQDGLISYIEPYSFNAAFNELDAARHADIPMGEFWMHQRFQTETAVSGGRIYGKKVISSESFAANSDLNWKGHPGLMKLTGDRAWTLGINEFMFHRFAHQANTHVTPGMTMAIWGSHIDRTQTWWSNMGKAWLQYIARGSYLLRQGNPVSDLLVFVGDGASSSTVTRSSFKPAIPAAVNFDCISTHALVHRVKAKEGKSLLPDGTMYQMLVLHNTDTLSLSSLKKIADLSEQGVVVVGKRPQRMGGHAVNISAREEFARLCSEVWQRETTYEDYDWSRIYREQNLRFDLVIGERTDITYIHRRTTDADIYFFFNPDSSQRTFDCQFNVRGRIPEQWDPATGQIRKLGQFSQAQETTRVPVTLDPEGSAFIVFRESTEGVDPVVSMTGDIAPMCNVRLTREHRPELVASKNGMLSVEMRSGRRVNLVVKNIDEPIVVDGPWQVSFEQHYGYDATLVFPSLLDWKDHLSNEVKHYSGTATYQTSFSIEPEMIAPDHSLELDLGRVEVSAGVRVNGKEYGVLWKSPYRVDISDAIMPGENQLTVEVTNLWINRLVGDAKLPDTSGYDVRQPLMPDWYSNNQKPPDSQRLTFTTYPHVKASDSLVPSGLIGPVRLFTKKTNALD
ncbi:glycosyl hydrolase [Novipirellula artificiosorum]|uniref:Glycosyl hydrolases family 2, sugar binding domain n=1 Tax=Novipirellula artificiosorum TaxID=2528016 RepID=A0A5C6D7N5_9BACT|nr:glycosyl hydrolase [Novipirellula artificiosorum]TWU33203.1 Glycosyl hydrolases family 2, sugar binding domain [Novipirellula artificiosorum]